ncbi:response regulator [Merismopedia glauca]|uniref:Two-component system response regulator n=1 Tax=Merismopedia glauca CCAP 1448/3 TaxID=1296344 RepID=A0A2T1C3R2_9CYAN|nr:response regulator [Merismopedia glauca]PSB02753.1 two-component system response regulator [Merismopedia glauca CCAP 1448/3]
MTSTLAPLLRQTPPLLIVEDSDEDFEALMRFLRRSPLVIPVERCMNGEQALAFLHHTDQYANCDHFPRPGMILLDLNLPGIDGREVLRRLKLDHNLKTIPVVIFTTSNHPNDIETCYQQGANSYIIKPIDINQLKRNVQTLVDYWFEVTRLPDGSAD